MQAFPRKKIINIQNSILQTHLATQKKPKEILRQRLFERQNFSNQTLDTIYPKDLNQELSK